jgi:hypothetical protein
MTAGGSSISAMTATAAGTDKLFESEIPPNVVDPRPVPAGARVFSFEGGRRKVEGGQYNTLYNGPNLSILPYIAYPSRSALLLLLSPFRLLRLGARFFVTTGKIRKFGTISHDK